MEIAQTKILTDIRDLLAVQQRRIAPADKNGFSYKFPSTAVPGGSPPFFKTLTLPDMTFNYMVVTVKTGAFILYFNQPPITQATGAPDPTQGDFYFSVTQNPQPIPLYDQKFRFVTVAIDPKSADAVVGCLYLFRY